MAKGIQHYLDTAEQYDSGDFAWVIVATVFCWQITFGVGFLYAGYSNRKNAMANVWISGCVLIMGSISWILFGLSFTYSGTNSFYGDGAYLGHAGVFEQPEGTIPILIFSLFALTFQTATIAIFMGGAAERARLTCLPLLAFVWPLVIYNPIAHWTWTDNGWAAVMGVLDFAGGSPVHIASGAASAAFSVYLSKPLFRSKKNASKAFRVCMTHRPHNLMHLFLAIVIIWGGWLAFDGCSTLALNMRSAVAAITTHVSACFGAAAWCLLEFIERKKWSFSAIVSGGISGLVAITPACGYVGVPASMLIGALGGSGCFFACKFKQTAIARKIGFMDPCDVTGCHWFGGFLGNLLTGIFAQKTIAATDGATEIDGGWLDGNFVQLGYQLADSVVVTLWAFVVTYILVALIDCIPGMEVLATEDEIVEGIDASYNGEFFHEQQWADEDERHPFLGTPLRPLSEPSPQLSSSDDDKRDKESVKVSANVVRESV